MSERIDHAAMARKHLEDVTAYENDAHSFRFDDEEGRAIQALSHAGLSAQQAKTHAALALVEQQRIANVIALAGLEMHGPLRHLAIQPDGEYSIDVKDHLKEALNLD